MSFPIDTFEQWETGYGVPFTKRVAHAPHPPKPGKPGKPTRLHGAGNCGSGKGGFRPGNTCGKTGRSKLAERLRAARHEARHGNGDAKKLRQDALALKRHRRGHEGSVSNDKARKLHAQLKERHADHEARKRLGVTAPKPEAPKQAPHEHTNHEPGHVGNLNTNLIHADPNRFQYKIGSAHETGSVGSLSGVRKYDENLGGVIQVWKDPKDGKTYVVNGHNRLDLAKRLGADKVTVRYLKAENHQEARSIGALTNIAEGRGTSVDAAKFFRDTGLTHNDIQERGIPLREKIATDGLALSRLDNSVFKRVTSGELSPERGAIIGAAGLKDHQQQALVKLLDKHRGKNEITNGQLKELVDEVKSARTVSKETHDLFGSSVEDESLALHKAKLQDTIKKRLASEKKLFGIVAKSKHATELARAGNQINTHESAKISDDAAQTLHIFDRLKRLTGPVSRRLNDAAERIHKGENAKRVTDETYKHIVADLPSIIERGQAFGS